MAIEGGYAWCVMEYGLSPPLTSRETLHWDRVGTQSRCWGPTENLDGVTWITPCTVMKTGEHS
jgi:hypothetical protein